MLMTSPFLAVMLLLLFFSFFTSSIAAPAEQDQQRDAGHHALLGVSESAKQSLIAVWANARLPGPPLIETEKQLDGVGRFVSPVLSGDLGSMMFQLAAVHCLAQKHDITCVVAWWDQSDTSLPEQYRPFGGQGEPAPGITLKHIFPALVYASFEPPYRGVLSEQLCHSERQLHGEDRSVSQSFDCAFISHHHIDRQMPLSIMSKDELLVKPFFDGDFYDPQCVSVMMLHVCPLLQTTMQVATIL
jgi:hypothetical protein